MFKVICIFGKRKKKGKGNGILRNGGRMVFVCLLFGFLSMFVQKLMKCTVYFVKNPPTNAFPPQNESIKFVRSDCISKDVVFSFNILPAVCDVIINTNTTTRKVIYETEVLKLCVIPLVARWDRVIYWTL